MRTLLLAGIVSLPFAAIAILPPAAASAAASPPAPGTVLPLWPDLAPSSRPAGEAGPGESVDDRGAPGRHNRAVSGVTRPSLTVFLPDKPDPARPAVVVCPGGGYRILAIDHEGYAIAERLNQAGIAAILLKYRLPVEPAKTDGTMPAPIQDVQRAIRLVRAHAGGWNIDSQKIGVMGFSAGGHAAGMATVRWEDADTSAADPAARHSSRPDFAILMYPVLSMTDALKHTGSRRNLLGESPSAETSDQFSVAKQVTAKTPPLFVVHANDDKGVVVEHSLELAEAAKRAGVPCELLLFETGGHGFGLGKPGHEAAVWPEKLEQWMRGHGLLATSPR